MPKDLYWYCTRKPAVCHEAEPGRERIGGGLSKAQIMHTAATGRTQTQDDERGLEQQDLFDHVICASRSHSPSVQ
jgi:hypothetical protein